MKSERILSIDALRGFDMLWIMGGAEFIQALNNGFQIPLTKILANQMEHVSWNGFHFYDMIFPLFLFLAGVSFPFSYQNRIEKGQTRKQILFHVLKRMLVLIILGIIYNGFLRFEFPARYASVLGRIGISWAIAAILVIFTKKILQLEIFVGILLIYWAILRLVPIPGVGAGILSPENSIVAFVDQNFLPGKLYFEHYDPEGILSTIPSVATALLGVFCGYILQCNHKKIKKVFYLFAIGVISLLIGWLWNFILPINKNVWTSSFVLYAGGWSVLLLAFFYYIIDVVGWKRWSFPFVVIGMNSITIYMAQPILGFDSPVNFFFGGLANMLPLSLQQSFLSFSYIIVCWLFLYFLYRKKILLKV